jgi:hypothetical protein
MNFFNHIKSFKSSSNKFDLCLSCYTFVLRSLGEEEFAQATLNFGGRSPLVLHKVFEQPN